MREEVIRSSEAKSQVSGAANGCGGYLNGCGSYLNGCGGSVNGCGSFAEGRQGATPIRRAWAAAKVVLG